eukprot:s147_g34.t1
MLNPFEPPRKLWFLIRTTTWLPDDPFFEQAKKHPFRLDREGALAYYRGMDDNYPEAHGQRRVGSVIQTDPYLRITAGRSICEF